MRKYGIPSFAVFAFANDDRTVRLLVTRSTSSFEFLGQVSSASYALPSQAAYFSSRYSSPRLTKAVSYSLMAASEVTEGGLEMISL